MVLLASMQFFIYIGIELGFGGYLFTYAVDYEGIAMSKPTAAWLTSLFWGTFAGGRLLAVGLAHYFSPMQMLVVDFVGSIASAVVMTLFKDNATVLWITTGTLGLFIASVWCIILVMLSIQFRAGVPERDSLC